jgi:hypothetical protein
LEACDWNLIDVADRLDRSARIDLFIWRKRQFRRLVVGYYNRYLLGAVYGTHFIQAFQTQVLDATASGSEWADEDP